MFTLEYAKDPFFQTEDQQCIHITVKWAEFNEEMPFGAMPTDVYEHGRQLFERAMAGEFGVVVPYTPSVTQAGESQPNTQGSQTL